MYFLVFKDHLILTGSVNTDLFSVQCSADSDFSTTRVNGELLQRVSTDDGVTQQTVDGTVFIGGCYLKETKGEE